MEYIILVIAIIVLAALLVRMRGKAQAEKNANAPEIMSAGLKLSAQEGLTALDSLMEQAYKQGYITYRTELDALIPQLRDSAITREEFEQKKKSALADYKETVFQQVGTTLYENGECVEDCADWVADHSDAAYEGLQDYISQYGFGAVGITYNIFHYALSGKSVSPERVTQEGERFRSYADTALRKALEKHWPEGAAEL